VAEGWLTRSRTFVQPHIPTTRENSEDETIDEVGDDLERGSFIEISTDSFEEPVSTSVPGLSRGLKRIQQKEMDESEKKTLQYYEAKANKPPDSYFFKSLLPYIEGFFHQQKLKFQNGVLDLITGICCDSSSTHPSTPTSLHSSVSSSTFHDSRGAEPLNPDSASQSPITQITTYNYSEQNPFTGDYCWPR
jgi:hypothetical protein